MTTWNSGRITLACAVAGMLVAAAVSFALPVHYLSQATLIVTPDDESTRGWANNVMERSIFNREVLASLIQAHNLYPRERARVPLDDVIDKMKRNIQVVSILPASPGNRGTLTFAIQFDHPERYVAQEVDEELLARLVEGNLHAQLDSHSTFYVPAPPSLPAWPAAPNRTRLVAVGLFAGSDPRRGDKVAQQHDRLRWLTNAPYTMDSIGSKLGPFLFQFGYFNRTNCIGRKQVTRLAS